MCIRAKLNYKHTLLACYITYIASATVNNLASLLFVTFQENYGITTPRLAALITFNFATQIIVDLLGAKFVDRIGYRTIAIFSELFCILGLVSLGILPVLMDNTYLGLCLASVAYAIGSGLAEVIVSPMVEALPGKAKESAMSILHSFYCWGQVSVVLLSTLYLTTVPSDRWYVLPILWAAVPLFALLLFLFVPINTLNSGKPTLPIRKLFTKKLFWLLVMIMMCGGAAELAMAQWASLFAEAALGVSKAVGNLLGPCFFAVMMGISRILYGKFSEKLPLVKALCLCGVITVIGYLTVSLVSNPYISLIGCGVIGFGVGIFWPGTLSLSAKKLPEGGTSMFALLAFSGDIGCSVGPALAAVVSAIQGISFSRIGLLACVIFPAIIFLSTFIMLTQKKDTCKELRKTLKKNTAKCHDFKIFKTLDSTNSYLKRSAVKHDGDICIAITQSSGRGRGDKPFYSFGEGLYMSLIYSPDFDTDTDTSVRFTCSAAVAVCESIRSVTLLNAEIKWVNDIYINEKKVCGILTELVREADKSYVIVGIGVNLISSAVPSELAQIASSLYTQGDRDIPSGLRTLLASEIINRFDRLYSDISTESGLIERYRALSLIQGREIDVIKKDGLLSAKAVQICDDFSLEVEYPNGEKERLTSGEVSLKLK